MNANLKFLVHLCCNAKQFALYMFLVPMPMCMGRYLDGRAKQYRQNLILTSFPCAEVNGVFHRHCQSHMGKVKAIPKP